MKSLVIAALVLLASTWLMSPASAQNCTPISGIEDYPGLPVYDGACLIGGSKGEFSNYTLPTGPLAPMSGAATTVKSEDLEGTLTRLLYVAPDGTSATDLMLNYVQGLEALGYSTLYSCKGAECGSKIALLGKKVIYPSSRRLTNSGGISNQAFGNFGDEHYLAVRSKDGATSIAVYVAFNDKSPFALVSHHAIVHLDILTTAALEAKMVSAKQMQEGITAEGHIAVDNVYFEFGTANLTPEAEPALAQMALLITDNPELKVYIVGHTDNVGKQEDNLGLSKARADAVVAALLRHDGITKDRVIAAGVGALAPVASNGTDAGRQANRRVELVER